MKHLYYDVAIAGCGIAGLYAALHLPPDRKILMLSKGDLSTCDSMLAQGGICVLRDEDDYDSYFEDTMRAGHYENRRESVDIMIRGSRSVINHLMELGVHFATNPDGSLLYTKEGARGCDRQGDHHRTPAHSAESFQRHHSGVHDHDGPSGR